MDIEAIIKYFGFNEHPFISSPYNGSKDSDKRRSSMKVEASKHGTTEETLFTGI
jgi:hypothetical protein